jgi:hypothetical protein
MDNDEAQMSLERWWQSRRISLGLMLYCGVCFGILFQSCKSSFTIFSIVLICLFLLSGFFALYLHFVEVGVEKEIMEKLLTEDRDAEKEAGSSSEDNK